MSPSRTWARWSTWPSYLLPACSGSRTKELWGGQAPFLYAPFLSTVSLLGYPAWLASKPCRPYSTQIRWRPGLAYQQQPLPANLLQLLLQRCSRSLRSLLHFHQTSSPPVLLGHRLALLKSRTVWHLNMVMSLQSRRHGAMSSKPG